jgi:hypothetical protein
MAGGFAVCSAEIFDRPGAAGSGDAREALPPALEGNTMPEPDGFPPAVAVWLGLAFAVALSLFTALAFGGFPWP